MRRIAIIITILLLALTAVAVKPDDCYATSLPSYKEYLYPQVARTWDSYTAQTEGVCVLNDPPTAGQCSFKYELRRELGPSIYLCWYGKVEGDVSVGQMPGFCKGTYLKGYREYSLFPEVKQLWDSYTAQSEGVCRIDRPAIPQIGDCKFEYDLVIPEYGIQSVLCWYGPKAEPAPAKQPEMIRPEPQIPSGGAPPGCEPVELDEYEEYEDPAVKSVWDSYTADSQDVCVLRGEPEDEEEEPLPEYPSPTPGCGNNFIDLGEECENDYQCPPGDFCMNCTCYSSTPPSAEEEYTPFLHPFETEYGEIPCVTSDVPGYTFTFTDVSDVSISDIVKKEFPSYTIIKEFNSNCKSNFMDITVSIPDQYTDLQMLKCSQEGCKNIETKTSSELTCDEEDLTEIQLSEIPARGLSRVEAISIETVLTSKEQTAEQDDYQVSLDLADGQSVKIKVTARAVPQPLNPGATILGTPIAVQLDKPVDTRITVSIPVGKQQNIDSYSLATVDEKGNFKLLGGEFKENAVQATLDTAKLFNNNLREAVFAVVGTYCDACKRSELEKVYDADSKELLVLLHGFGTDKATWQPLIDEFRMNKAPWDIAAFSYPYAQSMNETATEFINQLNAISGDYNKINIIGHSIGAMIAQVAIHEAQNTPLKNKLHNIILIGSPNEGTPVLQKAGEIAQHLVNEKSTKLIPFESETFKSYANGLLIDTVPGLNYFVMAGTHPYSFTEELFDKPNDGITTVEGAQHINGIYLTDRCNNFYDLNLTHTELTDSNISRLVIERIIAEERAKSNPEEAIIGYQQYLSAATSCDPEEIFVIIGKEIPEEQVPAPLNCACGNGYCGEGETAANCPVDCATFYSIQNLCFWIFIVISFILLIGALLTVLRSVLGELVIPPLAVAALALILMLIQSRLCFKFKQFQNIQWAILTGIIAVGLIIEIASWFKRRSLRKLSEPVQPPIPPKPPQMPELPEPLKPVVEKPIKPVKPNIPDMDEYRKMLERLNKK